MQSDYVLCRDVTSPSGIFMMIKIDAIVTPLDNSA